MKTDQKRATGSKTQVSALSAETNDKAIYKTIDRAIGGNPVEVEVAVAVQPCASSAISRYCADRFLAT